MLKLGSCLVEKAEIEINHCLKKRTSVSLNFY